VRTGVLCFLAAACWMSAATADELRDQLVAGSDTQQRTEPDAPRLGLGAGLVHAWVSSPLRAFDGGEGWGLQVTMEAHLTERTTWDVRFGGFNTALREPEEIHYPADDGDWATISSALRYDVARTARAIWWAGSEGSLHYVQMKHYDYSGTGFGIGPAFGIDVPSKDARLVTRFGAHTAWVWLETDSVTPSARTFVATFGLDVVYRFRRT